MAKIYKVLVNDGKGADANPINVMQSVGDKGEPVRLVAQKGVRYQLQDEAKGKGAAPDQVRVKRVGKNLTLMFDGSQSADVVVEDFYAVGSATDGNLPVLAGLAENGSVYEYIPQDPALGSVTPALADGNTPVLMALGGSALGETFALSALPLVAAAAGGVSGWAVAGAAVGTAALAGGGGGGGGGAAADTTPPGVAKLLVPDAADGSVNAAEAADGSAVKVSLPADALVGDTVTTVLTKPDGSKQTLTHVLTAQDIAAKSITQIIPVADLKDANGNYIDGTWVLTTTVTDAAKNVSTPVQSTFVLDTKAPETDAETPLNPSTGKASVVLDDVPIDGMVTGTVRGDFTAGDKVTLKISDKTYSYTVGADGKFSIPVPHEVLLADADKTIDASLAAHDAAGNLGTVLATKAYEVDGTPPTFESLAAATAVNENIAAGSVVYQAKATDTGFVAPATATTVSYSLKAGANDSNAFSIDAATGDVKLTASPNYEVKNSYNFVVIAKDAAGNTAEKEVTLAINNVDEVAPGISSSDSPASVNENISTNTVVYTVVAKDTDFNSTNTENSVTYKLKSSVDADALLIDSTNGEVRFKESPDFEKKSSYTFTVQAEDAVGNVSEKAVTLGVLNIAEVASLNYGKTPGSFSGKTSIPTSWTVTVDDQDNGENKLRSILSETGTYGKFEYDVANTLGNVYAWKYTLDVIPAIPPVNELDKLATTGHDLQVVQSFDGSAYKTIDIAINTSANTTTQIFNTNSTVGLTVDGLDTKTDTLVLHGLTGPSLTLDLTLATSAVGYTKLTSIESIDLTGSSNYTVRLNMDSLTQADGDSANIHKLLVLGSAGQDSVIFEGHASVDAVVVGSYDSYLLDSTHVLLVQHGMSVSFSNA
jgi:VCBS repeat-containing protein